MTTPHQSPADFWLRLNEAEAKRKALAGVTHTMTAKVQARVAQNDEPEPAVAKGEQ
jgi:hypothetical protein